MDPEGKKFGRGLRELTGAVDLLSHFKLLVHHDFFCKRALPRTISETHYLHNVVGDTEIRKGDGMELEQLLHPLRLRETTTYIQPFDIDTLGQAFQLQETAPIDLSSADKGIPTSSGKAKELENKSKKHKKHRDKDRDKEHKRHKHRHKDKSKDKDKDKEKKREKSAHHDKKRKLEGGDDITDTHKHKKSKVEDKFSSRFGISGAYKHKICSV